MPPTPGNKGEIQLASTRIGLGQIVVNVVVISPSKINGALSRTVASDPQTTQLPLTVVGLLVV